MAPSEAARAAPARASGDPRQIERLPDRLDQSKYHFLGTAESVIGVDIGAAGAIALLSRNGELLDVADMPVLADGPAGRRAVSDAPPISPIALAAGREVLFGVTMDMCGNGSGRARSPGRKGRAHGQTAAQDCVQRRICRETRRDVGVAGLPRLELVGASC